MKLGPIWKTGTGSFKKGWFLFLGLQSPQEMTIVTKWHKGVKEHIQGSILWAGPNREERKSGGMREPRKVLPKAPPPRQRWGPSFWGSSHARDGNYLFVTRKSIILFSLFSPSCVDWYFSVPASLQLLLLLHQSCPGSETVAFCQRPSAGDLCSHVSRCHSLSVASYSSTITLLCCLSGSYF